MSLSTSTNFQVIYEKWMAYLATGRPIKSFFLEGSENIREMRSTYQSLDSVQKFTDYLLQMAQEECNNGGNMLKANAALFDIMGGC